MDRKPLAKNYKPAEAEPRWQQHWVNEGTYHWAADAPREQTYVIDTPPPTVSGHLHMGHVFSYVQADLIARYQRMKGLDVFYPMGFDDNGLPTERLVEKTHKKRATDYESREAFIKVCEEVSEGARKDFRALFQSLALSVDWRQEYHTISEDCRRLSQQSFLDLYEKGHIERRQQPFFWDPVDQTAIAQAEMEEKELDSYWNDIWFGVEGLGENSHEPAKRPTQSTATEGSGDLSDKILIGTTRPEMIPACVGIFYHPDDARYQHLKGKYAITPLFGERVPILEDDSVEPDKGTGIMMCCTFGDEADIEKWRKHKLPMRVILNKYGKIDLSSLGEEWGCQEPAKAVDPFDRSQSKRQTVREKLQNKKVTNRDPKHPGAREIIIELLRESGDLKESNPIRHSVKCAERSGAALEIIPTQQWFVKLCDKKEALTNRARECTWYPDWMRLRMEQWIDGLNSDWCISRQRYYGVPFPVWYSKRVGEEGKILLPSPDQLPVNPLTDLPQGYSAEEVTPDADVMDTWATSSISPQINAGAICVDNCQEPAKAVDPFDRSQSERQTVGEKFNTLFPADLRPQAHEIIRTWAFYTVVKSHLHNDSIPWKDLMISGWCLAEDKTKMSKSKGNVVTPIALIEEHGTDAVRYWAATSKLGQDTAFSRDLLKIGKKLVTKLWNATKFASNHLDKADDGEVTAPLDRWILTRLSRTISKSTAAFEQYEYADALRATEDFFWNDFCDNYLELVKKRVYDEAGQHPEGQRSAANAIALCLEHLLRLFAPFIPHITEELFSHLFPQAYAERGSLHARGNWPDAASILQDEACEVAGIAAVEILEVIRKAKSEKGVSIKYPIETITIAADTALHDTVQSIAEDVQGAGNIHQLTLANATPAQPITSESGRFTLSICFAESADVA